MRDLSPDLVTVGNTTLTLSQSNSYNGNQIFEHQGVLYEQLPNNEAAEVINQNIVQEYYDAQLVIDALLGYTLIGTELSLYTGQDALDNNAIEYTLGNEPQELLDAIMLASIAESKTDALANIEVTTLAGNTFDGDDVARQDMLSALREGDRLGLTETDFWKLADNSFLVPCTYAELEEAHGLAIRAKGAILAG